MARTDPASWDQAVAASRTEFLDALGSYDPAVAESIIGDFLTVYFGPEHGRSTIATEQAQEAVRLIKEFTGVQAAFSMKVLILSQAMSSKLLSLQLDVLKAAIDPPDRPPAEADSESDPLSVALRDFDQLRQSRRTLRAASDTALETAEQILETVDRVQRRATTLLLLRHATLQQFRGEHLETTWADLRERIQEELRTESKDVVIRKSWEKADELLVELAKILWEEEFPAEKIPRILRKLSKVLGVKEIDPSLNLTDYMQLLLEQLRLENALFVDLRDEYSRVIEMLSDNPSS